METRVKTLQQARNEGHEAAKRGDMLNQNPYPTNTEHYDAWRKGWNKAPKGGDTSQSPRSGAAGVMARVRSEEPPGEPGWYWIEEMYNGERLDPKMTYVGWHYGHLKRIATRGAPAVSSLDALWTGPMPEPKEISERREAL